jgi:hypothetical protein
MKEIGSSKNRDDSAENEAGLAGRDPDALDDDAILHWASLLHP